ncbi:hypothetical protein EW026_g7450 [Hermanssonia centrifuga]|uniref:Uncharacterized protein n=1 Tax=Hermanssonia centrifuga TaxID=98765 RepID=A0A4V3X9E4_9APHY|nr:hypothetical protein EW026_g7450 [Hermanssonia centrifuga]
MSLNYQNYQVKQGNFNSHKFTQPLEETIKQAANKVEKLARRAQEPLYHHLFVMQLKPGQVQVPPLKEEYFMECRRYLPFIFPTLENQLFTMLNSRNEEVTILRTPYELLSRYGKVRIQGSWPGYPKIDFYVRLPSNASNSQLHSEVVKEFWNWFMRHKDEFSGHEEWRFPDYDNGDIEITGLCAVEGPFDKNKRCEWHLDIKLQRGYLRL